MAVPHLAAATLYSFIARSLLQVVGYYNLELERHPRGRFAYAYCVVMMSVRPWEKLRPCTTCTRVVHSVTADQKGLCVCCNSSCSGLAS